MACLEETAAHYCAALLTYAKSITDAFLARTQADHDAITDFFERYCIKEKVLYREHAAVPEFGLVVGVHSLLILRRKCPLVTAP